MTAEDLQHECKEEDVVVMGSINEPTIAGVDGKLPELANKMIKAEGEFPMVDDLVLSGGGGTVPKGTPVRVHLYFAEGKDRWYIPCEKPLVHLGNCHYRIFSYSSASGEATTETVTLNLSLENVDEACRPRTGDALQVQLEDVVKKKGGGVTARYQDGVRGYDNDLEAARAAKDTIDVETRKGMSLADEGNDPFEPKLVKAVSAGEGVKKAVYLIYKGGETALRFLKEGANTSGHTVDCDLKNETSEEFNEDHCKDPKPLTELTKTFTCDDKTDGDGKTPVTLELKEGAGVYILGDVEHTYEKEELPALEPSKIEVKVGGVVTTAGGDFKIAVKDGNVEMSFGDATKCKGKATSDPEGVPWWVFGLIVVAVLAVVVVAVVMLMPSAEDDEDDDDDDESESESDKNEP
jgi:hypothetical protein